MYSKQVQEYWETTSLENRDYRLFHRHRAVNLFMKKLLLSYGDAIRFCHDITDENKKLTVDDFTKDTMVEFEKIRNNDDLSTRWNRCLSFVLSKFLELERFESLNIRRYIEQFNKTGEIDSLLYDVDEETAKEVHYYTGEVVSIISPFYRVYNELYYTFEYKLSWRLCQFLSKKHMIDKSAKQELTMLAEAVCLYTALHNEQEKLYNEAAIYDVALPDLSEEEPTGIQEEPQKDTETATQTIAPAPQANETEPKATEVELPAELDNEDARALLQRVIKAGFCDANYVWDEKKWHEGEDVLALVCFAYMANKELNLIRKKGRKEVISWKPFDTLFTYRTKLNKESAKTQLQITKTNYMQSKNYTAFFVPNHIMIKLAPLFDKH